MDCPLDTAHSSCNTAVYTTCIVEHHLEPLQENQPHTSRDSLRSIIPQPNSYLILPDAVKRQTLTINDNFCNISSHSSTIINLSRKCKTKKTSRIPSFDSFDALRSWRIAESEAEEFANEQLLYSSQTDVVWSDVILSIVLFVGGVGLIVVGLLMLFGIFGNVLYTNSSWILIALGLILFVPGAYYVRLVCIGHCCTVSSSELIDDDTSTS